MRQPLRGAPALGGVFCFGVGCAAGDWLIWQPVLIVGVALWVGIAAHRTVGSWVAAVSLGVLLGGIAQERDAAPAPTRRVVEGAVVVLGPWTAAGGSADLSPSAPAVLRTIRLGTGGWAGRERIRLLWRAQAPLPGAGETLSVRSVLGANQGYSNRFAVAPRGRRLIVKSAQGVDSIEPPAAWQRWGDRVRRIVDRGLTAADGRATPGIILARAFLLGDTTAFPEEWNRGFRRTGLAHLLAVSGFNVTWVALIAVGCVPARPRGLRFLAASLAALAYLGAVGGQHPVERATTMILLGGMTLLARRPPVLAQLLALAAGVALARDPAAVFELSFLLSYSATAGLVLLTPALRDRWTALPRSLALMLAAGAATQLATLPWSLGAWGQVQVFGLIYNAVAAPWAIVMLFASLVACLGVAFLAPAWPGLAPWAHGVLDLLVLPVEWISKPGPLPGLLLAPPSVPLALIATVVAACLVWWPRRMALATLALTALAFAPWNGLRRVLFPASWTPVSLVAFDVGQGDATLLRGTTNVLVDGGGWQRGDFGGRVLLPALVREGVRRLDVVVVSHSDRDHCAGLADIVDYLPVGEVWLALAATRSQCVERLVAAANGRVVSLAAGARRRSGAWALDVLWPPADSAPAQENDASLVVRVSIRGQSILLTGDIGSKVESQLIRSGVNLKADMLKLAHHGSGGSNSSSFLAAVAPRWAWVSSGRPSPFGHPAPATLGRVEHAAIPLLRTDRDGQITWTVAKDGRSWIELPRHPGTLRH